MKLHRFKRVNWPFVLKSLETALYVENWVIRFAFSNETG